MEIIQSEINWGAGVQTDPDSAYEYVLYNPSEGELDYLYVGYWGEARRLAMRDALHNWVHEPTERANQGFLPMYNVMALSSKHRVSAKIVIVQTEAETAALEGFFRESQDQYVAVSFLSGLQRQPDARLFRGRDVVLWPHRGEEGAIWASRLEGYLKRSAASVKYAAIQSARGNNLLDVLRAGGTAEVLLAIESTDGGRLELPIVRLINGFSSLSGFIPPAFKDIISARYGDEKTGKIDADYEKILQICEDDPAFKNFVKLNRATAQMCFSPVYHESYDEADNAFLNRLTQYRVKRPEKSMRQDIIKTLSLREGAVFNSVVDHFNRLSVKYPEPKNRLFEILSHIVYEENEKDKRGLYFEMFDIYFSRAATHVIRAYGEDPIPNDLVPVLVGGQGVGKSRFARWLSMDQSLFMDLGDKGVTLGSPDCIRHIAGKVLVELSEMSVYTRTEIGTAKAFISQTVDEFRQLFERGMTRVPRSANFIGTTNEAQFLRDMTGNRRFFPVRVKSIDHDFLYAHPEMCEEMWAYYWRQAKYSPQAWFELSIPVQEFFFQENSIAMDIGFNSELAEQAIHNLEPEIYNKRKAIPRATSMWITSVAIGAEIQRMGGNLPSNINRIIRYHLMKLGYEDRPVRDGGRIVRAMCINLDNKDLVERCSKRVLPEPKF